MYGLPWWLSVEESACQAGDASLIPGLGTSPEGRNGNPLLYSCLGNPMDRGTWQAAVHGGHKRVGHDLVTKQQSIVYICKSQIPSSSHPFLPTLVSIHLFSTSASVSALQKGKSKLQ